MSDKQYVRKILLNYSKLNTKQSIVTIQFILNIIKEKLLLIGKCFMYGGLFLILCYTLFTLKCTLEADIETKWQSKYLFFFTKQITFRLIVQYEDRNLIQCIVPSLLATIGYSCNQHKYNWLLFIPWDIDAVRFCIVTIIRFTKIYLQSVDSFNSTKIITLLICNNLMQIFIVYGVLQVTYQAFKHSKCIELEQENYEKWLLFLRKNRLLKSYLMANKQE